MTYQHQTMLGTLYQTQAQLLKDMEALCSPESKALYFEFPAKAYIKTDESAKIYEDLWSLVPDYVKCCREEAESN
jgi:hypothetical protein